MSEHFARRPEPGKVAPDPNTAALLDTLARLPDDDLLAVVTWVQAETRRRAEARGEAAAELARIQLLLTDAATAADAAVKFYLLSVAHQILEEQIDQVRRALA